jgi:acetoin utilization deacetylase AcuC-like enzyme
MGFCLFNNVAVGAEYAIRKYGKQRVAIYDFDVHHGNGTQHIFYDRPDVLYLSHHQFPLYPGTGDWTETGQGDGMGMTVNCPLPAGSGDNEVLYLYDHLFEPVLTQYRPEILFLSAGFDAHERDPLAQLCVTDEGFFQLFVRLETWSRATGVPLIYALEGGYNLAALAQGAASVLSAHDSSAPVKRVETATPLSLELLGHARNTFSSFWKL